MLNSGLFDGLCVFADLEKVISSLPTPKERGDAFEVFAEAYLATQRITQAVEVWPFETIPHEHLSQLALDTGRDMGVDGLYRDVSGDLRAYQVKFRAGRASLSWEELSTFMGLTDQISQRVLFTNSDTLPALMKERQGFLAIRGSDLDRLEPSDFKQIRQWLAGVPVAPARKSPLPHQQEALDALELALVSDNRATVVMACGTGKTLVALWAAEKTKARRVLVLVPSLALVRQVLHEWLRETSWANMSYLCVCSDPTVAKGDDALIVRQADLDFPVTTDPDAVRRFLARPFDGTRVVFSTYQSASVVARGMDQPFELGIFDEAHKTAGREGTRFSFALDDSNLRIDKRVFFTATPRHYDVGRKDKEGDAALVYSMDQPGVYGQVAHTLSFADAARRDIICDYKVVISVVTSQMLNDFLLRHGEVLVQGDLVMARQVALEIALQRAVEQYEVQRIFTFHGSVRAAESFISDRPEGVRTHLPDFSTYHVSGTMPTARREQYLTAFRAAAKAVMSNARCLTEGIDVPAVDMVAFMSPRKSKVDIVQATGRAMRKSPGKRTGYILVPLFLEQSEGELIEDALARTDYEDIWDVLGAMKEQDEVLADIIRQMREDRGRIGGCDQTAVGDKLEVLGPSVSLEVLRSSVTTSLVERLGASWDEYFGQLRAFQETHGHCNVPVPFPGDPQFGNWVGVQRIYLKRDKLRPDRRAKLESIGFVWDPHDINWESMFQRLAEYKRLNGTPDIHINVGEQTDLARWLVNQRVLKKRGKLRVERERRLTDLGITWDLRDRAWEESYEKLQAYKARFGDCNIPDMWAEDRKLGAWVGIQRNQYKSGKLADERLRRLVALGFDWDPFKTAWEKMYAMLTRFHEANGHCVVLWAVQGFPGLSSWVGRQRLLKRRGKLADDLIARLEELGFVWNVIDQQWENGFAELLAFHGEHGHCLVPQETPLGHWVSTQRQAWRKGKLEAERIHRLEVLGFQWEPRAEEWDKMLARLRQYIEQQGHCDLVGSNNPELARWLGKQRGHLKRGELLPDREAQLRALGVTPDARDSYWERMVHELERFRQKHGHCRVSRGYAEDPELALWVTRLRDRKMKSKLSALRMRQLEALGFEWELGGEEARDQTWNEMLRALVQFQREYGHFEVPKDHNGKLANWVATQRQFMRKGLLKPERVEQLKGIGFIESHRDDHWQEMYQRLAEYKRQHGDCLVPAKYPHDPNLGHWVSAQRALRRQHKMSPEQLAQLDGIGFVWQPARGAAARRLLKRP